MFLKRVHELLLGEHGFYDDIFQRLGMPYEAVKWRPDINPIDREEAMLHKQMQVAKLIRVHRVRGHLIADLDPLRWKEPTRPSSSIRRRTASRSGTSTASSSPTVSAGVAKMRLGDLLGVLRDAYCRTIGVEYMHIQETDEQRWIQNQVEGVHAYASKEQKDRILERLNAAEAFEKFLATKYVGTKRFGIEGAESAIPILDEIISAAADAGLDSCVIGMAHRGRLNVLSNIMGNHEGVAAARGAELAVQLRQELGVAGLRAAAVPEDRADEGGDRDGVVDRPRRLTRAEGGGHAVGVGLKVVEHVPALGAVNVEDLLLLVRDERLGLRAGHEERPLVTSEKASMPGTSATAARAGPRPRAAAASGPARSRSRRRTRCRRASGRRCGGPRTCRGGS